MSAAIIFVSVFLLIVHVVSAYPNGAGTCDADATSVSAMPGSSNAASGYSIWTSAESYSYGAPMQHVATTNISTSAAQPPQPSSLETPNTTNTPPTALLPTTSPLSTLISMPTPLTNNNLSLPLLSELDVSAQPTPTPIVVGFIHNTNSPFNGFLLYATANGSSTDRVGVFSPVSGATTITGNFPSECYNTGTTLTHATPNSKSVVTFANTSSDPESAAASNGEFVALWTPPTTNVGPVTFHAVIMTSALQYQVLNTKTIAVQSVDDIPPLITTFSSTAMDNDESSASGLIQSSTAQMQLTSTSVDASSSALASSGSSGAAGTPTLTSDSSSAVAVVTPSVSSTGIAVTVASTSNQSNAAVTANQQLISTQLTAITTFLLTIFKLLG